MPRQSTSKADELVGSGSTWEVPAIDPTFTEEFADGALEWAEALYGTVPPYREGWAHIHHQDRDEWLGSFRDLREPLEALTRWNDRGMLSRTQKDRFASLLETKAAYDPVIAELSNGAGPPPKPQRTATDGYDLL